MLLFLITNPRQHCAPKQISAVEKQVAIPYWNDAQIQRCYCDCPVGESIQYYVGKSTFPLIDTALQTLLLVSSNREQKAGLHPGSHQSDMANYTQDHSCSKRRGYY